MSGDTNIEELWSTFRDGIHSSINRHVPSKLHKYKRNLPWLNRNLKTLLKKKARLYKHAKKTGSWNKFRQYQKECKRQMRRAEWDHVNKVIQEGMDKHNSKPFWNYVKSKKQDNLGISPLKKRGNLVTDPKGKAAILIDQFNSVFTSTADSTVPNISSDDFPSAPHLRVSREGLLKQLLSINTSKANGPDSIPNIVLKNCANELASGLTLIFQYSLDFGVLPEDWRNANVTPVFKKGDKHSAENYRPISLTSITSKILEHIICSHLLKHFEKHRVLTTLNHGFRSGFSTETQLLVTMHDLLSSFEQKQQVDIAILDFSKAFDTVPHQHLLEKISHYGVKGQLLKWLSSFLTQRSMNVVVDGEHSRSIHVKSGVPQGTVLGPLMFLCHINDLPLCVNSQVRLFADDCLLYRQIRNFSDHLKLQEDLQSLEKWASTWGMRFNAKKCYILSTRSKSTYYYDLNKTVLKHVDSNPYLGLLLSQDMTWSNHIANICKKANSTLGFLRRNLKHCPQECRKTAFIALVRSQLEYGSIIWDPYLKKDIDKLEKIQRLGVRFILNDYKTKEEGCVTRMLTSLKLDTLQERRHFNRLVMLYKIAGGMVPAVDPDVYLTRHSRTNKRNIKPKTYSDSETSNIINRRVAINSRSFNIPYAHTEQFKSSFFVKTLVEWNHLAEEIVRATTVEGFKQALPQQE